MKTKFAFVICKYDENKQEVINKKVLENNFNCKKISNLSKKLPSVKENFSDLKIKDLRKLKEDFNPITFGMYDLTGLGSHSVNLYMFSDDANESGILSLQSSLNLIKYGKNYFINFSFNQEDILRLFDTKELIIWFLNYCYNLNSAKKQWLKIFEKYRYILNDDQLSFVTNNLSSDDPNVSIEFDKIRSELRHTMLSMLKNGWN